MKLHYLLYFVIGSVASYSTENLKGREGILQNQLKECGHYKKVNVYDGESNVLQNNFENINNVNAQISTVTETVQNDTEQTNRFHRIEEKVSSLDTNPLFFVPNPTRNIYETANPYFNQNAKTFTQRNANFSIQGLGHTYPNPDLQESKQTNSLIDAQKQLRIDPTFYLRRVMQLGLIKRHQRTSKMYFLQQKLRDYQISAQSHRIENTWKTPELDFSNASREILQPGFTHDLEEFLHLERDDIHDVNRTNDFSKRMNFIPVHDNHSYEVNRDSGIESRDSPSFLERKVRILSMLRHKDFSDSQRNAFYLNISRNPKMHDSVHYCRNMEKYINNKYGRKDDFGTPNEVDQTRNARNCKYRTPRESFHFTADNIIKELIEVMPTTTQRKKGKAFPTHILKAVLTPKPIQLDLSHNMRKPVQLNPIQNMREPAKVYPTHNLQKPVQLNPIHNLREPVKVHPTHNLQNPVQLNPIHNMREPVKVHPTHNLQNPVQLNPIHNMREPVKVHPAHNLQTPVQLDPTHDMRRPVQLHPSHDLRRPVKAEPTHDLRTPVKLMESHDLRWPVIEEPDHNMRNPITEDDILGSDNEDGELKAFVRGRMRKLSKYSFVDDPLYEFLYEDEFIFLKCSRDQVNFNPVIFTAGNNFGNEAVKPVTKYDKVFNESIKACGVPFNHSKDNLRGETKLTKWPWMVSLQQYILNKFWHKCAGSLINNLWVITAAHCVESKPKWDFLLQLGMNEDIEHYIERFVDRMSIHPKFNSLNLDHDIALIRMDAPVTFQSTIVPICLPWKTDEIEKKKAVALAWRLDKEKNDFDEFSREKTVPVLTNKECEVMFSETGSSESIQKSFLCASFENVDQDSCGGDSGGPLVIFDDNDRWILAGIYSWGKSCRTPNQPEVYIRISRYTKWIENTIMCYEENIRLYTMD